MQTNLNGIFPALVTPFNSDQTLNTPVLEQLLDRVYSAEVDGVYVCGSTGEGLMLPADLRRKIVEVAVKNSPRGKQVIVHVGAWSFAETQALAHLLKYDSTHGTLKNKVGQPHSALEIQRKIQLLEFCRWVLMQSAPRPMMCFQ